MTESNDYKPPIKERPGVTGAEASEAKNTPISFHRADLDGADLGGTDLGEARLVEANLGGTNLGGAKLIEADFSKARNLTCNQLTSAKNWKEATTQLYCRDPDETEARKK